MKCSNPCKKHNFNKIKNNKIKLHGSKQGKKYQ